MELAFQDEIGLARKKAAYKRKQEQLAHQLKANLQLNIKNMMLRKNTVKDEQLEQIDFDNILNRKMSVHEQHLKVFGCRNESKGAFYIYLLTNMKGSTNRQSPIEIEVWKWNDDSNCIERVESAKRQNLSRFIMDHDGKSCSETETFYRTDQNGQAVEKDSFWNKMPTSFTQATDDPSRIIFAAGSRGNYVFDLKMLNGELRLYSPDDVQNGKAIGLQKRAYVRMLDMIDDNFINMLSQEKVAKWQRTTKLDSFENNLKETQLRDLPYVLKLPQQIYGSDSLDNN